VHYGAGMQPGTKNQWICGSAKHFIRKRTLGSAIQTIAEDHKVMHNTLACRAVGGKLNSRHLHTVD